MQTMVFGIKKDATGLMILKEICKINLFVKHAFYKNVKTFKFESAWFSLLGVQMKCK